MISHPRAQIYQGVPSDKQPGQPLLVQDQAVSDPSTDSLQSVILWTVSPNALSGKIKQPGTSPAAKCDSNKATLFHGDPLLSDPNFLCQCLHCGQLTQYKVLK